jgi:hypothetical protein
MAKLTYELNVDGHFDNYYIIKRDGVKFGHIFCLDENKKKIWAICVGRNIVAKKAMWNDAWNWFKSRELPDVIVPDAV